MIDEQWKKYKVKVKRIKTREGLNNSEKKDKGMITREKTTRKKDEGLISKKEKQLSAAEDNTSLSLSL